MKVLRKCELEASKRAANAACVFDVGHAAFWLARTGTSIAQAAGAVIIEVCRN